MSLCSEGSSARALYGWEDQASRAGLPVLLCTSAYVINTLLCLVIKLQLLVSHLHCSCKRTSCNITAGEQNHQECLELSFWFMTIRTVNTGSTFSFPSNPEPIVSSFRWGSVTPHGVSAQWELAASCVVPGVKTGSNWAARQGWKEI